MKQELHNSAYQLFDKVTLMEEFRIGPHKLDY